LASCHVRPRMLRGMTIAQMATMVKTITTVPPLTRLADKSFSDVGVPAPEL
jgi:hypothetical protein